MGRQERPAGYYVRVDPLWIGAPTASTEQEAMRMAKWRRDCEAIAKQVERHVDAGSVFVVTESVAVCEFCGGEWDQGDGSPHNAGCCDKDCEMYKAVGAPGSGKR